jgi:hypothetical protein
MTPPHQPPDHEPQEPHFESKPLLPAMLAVAHADTPANRHILYQALLATWFVVPVREMPAARPGFHDMDPDTPANFSLEHDSDGNPVLPVFTDEEALRNWNKDIPWIAMRGEGFFRAVAATEAGDVVINPYEPENPASKMIRPGGRVARWEFELLAQGLNPQDNMDEESSSVLLATPKEMPAPAFFQALCAVAKAIPSVEAIYFSQIMFSETMFSQTTDARGGSRRGLAVDFAEGTSEGAIRQALDELDRCVRPLLATSELLDLFSSSSDLGQAISRNGQKFYQRQSP